MNLSIRKITLVILAIGILTLIVAIWGGLQRTGWDLPKINNFIAAYHGPLMVSGFLGTLISLERAKGLGKNWAYISPSLVAAGTVLLISGTGSFTAKLFITAGSIILLLIFINLMKISLTLFTFTMALGALLWIAGNILWLFDLSVARIVPWWTAFLVITIAAERLELSRVTGRTETAKLLFTGCMLLFITGTVYTLFDRNAGIWITGISLVCLTLWLLHKDVARRTVYTQGLTRFIASSLLAGYFWLGVGGILAILYPGYTAGPLYDAILHSVFLGFVFSMIFAHAPVIFPSVLELPVRYTPVFYTHLALLHFSLLIRVTGDLAGLTSLRSYGALLNAISILLFLFNTIRSVRGTLKAG